MDAQTLADQIHTVLRQNGYPDRRVRLPYHQIYRPAVDNGFALEDSLDILKCAHRIDHQRDQNRMLFFPLVKPAPQCDSKVVDKAIRRIIRPLFKQSGFTINRGRNSWRREDDATCVINFQSFNAYNADIFGCTTFSLALNAGVFLHDVSRVPWHSPEIPEFPKEFECQLRMSAHKPDGYSDSCDIENIWSIEPDGSNIDAALTALRGVIADSVLPWFDRHLDLDVVLHRFLNDTESADTEVYFGSPYSPARASVICGLLLAKNDVSGARQYLEDALMSDCSPGTRELQLECHDLFNTSYPVD